MLTLYIHPEKECKSCEKVMEWVIRNKRSDVEFKKEYQTYSPTYPTLTNEWGYITNSDKIIEHLETIKHD